ncbi:MAG: site-specific integrase [Leptolyngbyaceae cyanobacterium SU_3_3]|nr:site-specific integrase [Leptolyngbyaceae cyanobacterium SU_3_3]
MDHDLTPALSPTHLKFSEIDVLEDLLRDKRSPNTKRAYREDLNDFFRKLFMEDPTPQMVGQFLAMEHYEALRMVSRYKAILIKEELAEATVNRRLSEIRSLMTYARRAGQCEWGWKM